MNNTPSLKDFGASPLRFEMELILEEYRCLRAEIIVRLSNEQQILNFAITLLVGTLAAIQFLPLSQNFIDWEASFRGALLVISLIFSAFGLLSIEIDMGMVFIGQYIEKSLKPRMEEILAEATDCPAGHLPKVWGWEDFRATYQYHTYRAVPIIFMSLGRYALTVIPAVVVLIVYFTWRNATHQPLPVIENILCIFTTFVVVAVILTGAFNGMMFVNLSETVKQMKKPMDSYKAFRKTVRFSFLSKNPALLIPLITLLLGFIPMLILSLFNGTFALNSWVPFPFLSIPSVFIGDALFLPFLNYQYFKFLKSTLGKPYFLFHRSSSLIVLALAFCFSLATNIYSHHSWVQDAYLGFMDTSLGQLSPAGWVHFGFSTLEMAVTFSMVGLFVLFFINQEKKNIDAFLRVWYIVVAFSMLSLGDFLMRNLVVFGNKNLWQAFQSESLFLAQLYFALAVLIGVYAAQFLLFKRQGRVKRGH